MKWFSNLKVAVKVFLCCFVFLSIISGLALQSYVNTKEANQSMTALYQDRFQPVRWLNRMARNILQRRINMIATAEALAAKNTAEVKKRMEDSVALGKANEDLWKQYMATKMDDKEKSISDAYHAENEKLRQIYDEYVKAINAGNLALAKEHEVEWLPQYRVVREKLDAVIVFQDEYAQQMMKHEEQNYTQTVRILIIAWVIAVIMGVIITIVLARAVSGPVNKGLSFAQKIAKGDFTERIDLNQKDELGILGKALNDTADNLEKLIADILVAAQNLTQAVQEIASGNENLSQRTSEQASSLEEIASTIEETTATINQNADNSKEADKLSRGASTEAEDGGRVVYEAVAAISDISDSSKKIEEIISVINEIAFQTNLLALNAAVEAARAGEQGRGFAVVAGEVRNLAQRSGNAAKEIAELIKDSRNKVTRGTELANKSGEALKKIVESIKSVGKYVSEIAAASEEQRQGVSQINVAVEELDSMTQQNAGLVEETASASEEMANQAQELLAMMEKFKIRDSLKNESFTQKHKEVHLRTNTGAGKSKTVAAAKPSATGATAAAKKEKGSIEEILTNEGFEEF